MNFRKHSPRWALWAVALAFLLKSAMPFLASTAAEASGRTVAEVCTAYGVAMVVVDGDAGHGPAQDSSIALPGDHCVLGGLVALASAEPPVAPTIAWLPRAVVRVEAPPAEASHDASATWVALLKHGPPSLT